MTVLMEPPGRKRKSSGRGRRRSGQRQAQAVMDMDRYRPGRDPHTYAMQRTTQPSFDDDGDDDGPHRGRRGSRSGRRGYSRDSSGDNCRHTSLRLGDRIVYSGIVGLVVGLALGGGKAAADYITTGTIDWADVQEFSLYTGLGGGVGAYFTSKFIKV